MRIDVQKLVGEMGTSTEAEFDPDPEELKYEEIQLAGRPHVEAVISNLGGVILGDVHVDCRVTCECARCLKPFVADVHGERTIEYHLALSEETEAAETAGTFVSQFDGQEIVLDEDVRQIIVLETPGQPICREDCKGLCPACGADLNDTDCGHRQKKVEPSNSLGTALRRVLGADAAKREKE